MKVFSLDNIDHTKPQLSEHSIEQALATFNFPSASILAQVDILSLYHLNMPIHHLFQTGIKLSQTAIYIKGVAVPPGVATIFIDTQFEDAITVDALQNVLQENRHHV